MSQALKFGMKSACLQFHFGKTLKIHALGLQLIFGGQRRILLEILVLRNFGLMVASFFVFAFFLPAFFLIFRPKFLLLGAGAFSILKVA